MVMTPKDKELHDAEVARIRKEHNVPDDVPVVILDVDQESADWIARSSPESIKAREKFRRDNNREEGGE